MHLKTTPEIEITTYFDSCREEYEKRFHRATTRITAQARIHYPTPHIAGIPEPWKLNKITCLACLYLRLLNFSSSRRRGGWMG